jgi:hypothetical protein
MRSAHSQAVTPRAANPPAVARPRRLDLGKFGQADRAPQLATMITHVPFGHLRSRHSPGRVGPGSPDRSRSGDATTNQAPGASTYDAPQDDLYGRFKGPPALCPWCLSPRLRLVQCIIRHRSRRSRCRLCAPSTVEAECQLAILNLASPYRWPDAGCDRARVLRSLRGAPQGFVGDRLAGKPQKLRLRSVRRRGYFPESALKNSLSVKIRMSCPCAISSLARRSVEDMQWPFSLVRS